MQKEALAHGDSRLRSALDSIVNLLSRDFSSDITARERLYQALAQSPSLLVACQFLDRLQAIWRPPASLEHERHVVHALQEWCQQAEKSGIAALREFSHLLAGGRRV